MKVGDIVVLNDYGLETIFGNAQGLAHMKTLKMRITDIAEESITEPEPTYAVRVDNKDIDFFLIFDTCFDVVEGERNG